MNVIARRSGFWLALLAACQPPAAIAGGSSSGTWDGEGADNEWTTVENWEEDTAPSDSIQAVFDNGSPADQTVLVSQDVTANGLLFDDPLNGTFQVDGVGIE